MSNALQETWLLSFSSLRKQQNMIIKLGSCVFPLPFTRVDLLGIEKKKNKKIERYRVVGLSRYHEDCKDLPAQQSIPFPPGDPRPSLQSKARSAMCDRAAHSGPIRW